MRLANIFEPPFFFVCTLCMTMSNFNFNICFTSKDYVHIFHKIQPPSPDSMMSDENQQSSTQANEVQTNMSFVIYIHIEYDHSKFYQRPSELILVTKK